MTFSEPQTPYNPPSRTTRKRNQRRRQRDRMQKLLGERKGERDRARRDRENLARWIEANVEGTQVERGKSGRWFVVT